MGRVTAFCHTASDGTGRIAASPNRIEEWNDHH